MLHGPPGEVSVDHGMASLPLYSAAAGACNTVCRRADQRDFGRSAGFAFHVVELEAKLLGVELNCPLDVPRPKDRVRFFEHCNVQTRWSHERRSVRRNPNDLGLPVISIGNLGTSSFRLRADPST